MQWPTNQVAMACGGNFQWLQWSDEMAEKQVAIMVDELSDNLSSDMAYTPSSLSKFIGLCNYIKSSLLICEIHHNLESDIDEQVCKECENMLLKGPGSGY